MPTYQFSCQNHHKWYFLLSSSLSFHSQLVPIYIVIVGWQNIKICHQILENITKIYKVYFQLVNVVYLHVNVWKWKVCFLFCNINTIITTLYLLSFTFKRFLRHLQIPFEFCFLVLFLNHRERPLVLPKS